MMNWNIIPLFKKNDKTLNALKIFQSNRILLPVPINSFIWHMSTCSIKEKANSQSIEQ